MAKKSGRFPSWTSCARSFHCASASAVFRNQPVDMFLRWMGATPLAHASRQLRQTEPLGSASASARAREGAIATPGSFYELNGCRMGISDMVRRGGELVSRCGASGIDLRPSHCRGACVEALSSPILRSPKLILDRGLSRTPGPSMDSQAGPTRAVSWWDAGPQGHKR